MIGRPKGADESVKSFDLGLPSGEVVRGCGGDGSPKLLPLRQQAGRTVPGLGMKGLACRVTFGVTSKGDGGIDGGRAVLKELAGDNQARPNERAFWYA